MRGKRMAMALMAAAGVGGVERSRHGAQPTIEQLLRGMAWLQHAYGCSHGGQHDILLSSEFMFMICADS